MNKESHYFPRKHQAKKLSDRQPLSKKDLILHTKRAKHIIFQNAQVTSNAKLYGVHKVYITRTCLFSTHAKFPLLCLRKAMMVRSYFNIHADQFIHKKKAFKETKVRQKGNK